MARSSMVCGVAIAMSVLASCAHGPRAASTLTFSPGQTALDVIRSLDDTRGVPDVGLLVSTKPRLDGSRGLVAWGSLNLGDGFAVVAGRQIFRLPEGRRSPLRSRAPMALVRVTVDGSHPTRAWYDRIVSVVEVDTGVDLAALFLDARARCTDFLAQQAPALTSALAQAGADTPGQPLAHESQYAREIFAPTWTSSGVAVVCGLRKRRSSTTISFGSESTCASRLGVGPARPCQSPQATMTSTTRSYAAAVALVLRYGSRGELLIAERFAPVAKPGPAPVPVTR